MFGAILNPAYTCRTTIILETLEDGSFQIDSLVLNICFSYRNVFQNGVNALSKMVLKNRLFVKKLKISRGLENTILFKFH